MLEGPPRSELRHAVPERRRQPGPALRFPGRDCERKNEVVVGPFPPVECIFRPVMTHFEAEVDEFSGQKSRVRKRSGDLEPARLQQPLRGGNYLPCRGAMGIAGRCGAWPRHSYRPPRRAVARLTAAGWARARWIHRFVSRISTRSDCCPCWFDKQPEKAVRKVSGGR
jgi:hypothetical protein